MTVIDLFFSSFQQYSLIWIIISGFIGALISSSIKFIFENIIPEWKIKKASRIAVQKYFFPLWRSGYFLKSAIEDQLLGQTYYEWKNDVKYDYHQLRLLYFFGSFFGWSKVLDDESVLDFIEQNPKINSGYLKKFAIYYNSLLGSISHKKYFNEIDNNLSTEIELSRIPALALSCIGELMIKKTKSVGIYSDIISFLEFSQQYKENAEFKKWFSYLENLFIDLQKEQNNLKWNRLIIFYTHLCIFNDFMNRNSKKSILTRSTKIEYLSLMIQKIYRKKVDYLIIQKKICERINPKVKRKLVIDLNRFGYKISYVT